jgi:hypothetical protein
LHMIVDALWYVLRIVIWRNLYTHQQLKNKSTTTALNKVRSTSAHTQMT